MHYPNYISLPSSKCVDKLFTDFSGGFDPDTETADLPASTARFCTNLTAAFNSLTPSIGLSDDNFALPAGTLKVWYFEQAQTFFAIDSSFQLYSKSAGNSSFTAVTDAVFNALPEFFVLKIQNYFRAVFSAPGEPLIVWRSNSETYSVIADLDISQAVFFDGSLFAISHSSPYIHRSAVTELTDWNFSEKESFDLSAIGCLRKLVVTGNSLAVFGDRGIAKIGRYDSSLSAAVVFISPGDIFKDTVAAVGDSIFFTTDKALFSYNGVDTVKLIRRLALSDPFAFASRDGYNLFSSSFSYLYDIFTGNFSANDFAAEITCALPLPEPRVFIPSLSNNLLALSPTNSFAKAPVSGVWTSPVIFSSKQVRIHSLSLRCNCPVSVTISKENYCRTFTVIPSDNMAKIPVDITGKDFTFSFSIRLEHENKVNWVRIQYTPLG